MPAAEAGSVWKTGEETEKEKGAHPVVPTMVPVAVVPVAVVCVPAPERRHDRIDHNICRKDGARGPEPGELPPHVVLQQHVRMRPPAQTRSGQRAPTGPGSRPAPQAQACPPRR